MATNEKLLPRISIPPVKIPPNSYGPSMICTPIKDIVDLATKNPEDLIEIIVALRAEINNNRVEINHLRACLNSKHSTPNTNSSIKDTTPIIIGENPSKKDENINGEEVVKEITEDVSSSDPVDDSKDSDFQENQEIEMKVNFAIWGSHLSKHINIIKNKMFDDESINLDRGILIIYEKGGEYFAYFQVYNDQSIITDVGDIHVVRYKSTITDFEIKYRNQSKKINHIVSSVLSKQETQNGTTENIYTLIRRYVNIPDDIKSNIDFEKNYNLIIDRLWTDFSGSQYFFELVLEINGHYILVYSNKTMSSLEENDWKTLYNAFMEEKKINIEASITLNEEYNKLNANILSFQIN